MSKKADFKDIEKEYGKPFVGTRMVENYSVVEEQKLVGVLYADGTEENMSISQWESVKSDEPYANEQISPRKYRKVTGQIIETALAAHRVSQDKSEEAVDQAVRTTLELIMENLCTIPEYQFVLQQVESAIRAVTTQVDAQINGTFRKTTAQLYGVENFERIEVAAVHNTSLELSKDLGDNEDKESE
jgi:hypothetical protein